MGGIFISYRREDSGPYAGRLRDALSHHFGANQVFRDIDRINPGERFPRVIEQEVASCQALLAVIGSTWLSIKGDAGRRRLNDPEDYVRLEIATALGRDDVLVIPVLVGTTSMPAAVDLPRPLASLAECNAVRLSDENWDDQVARLTRALEKVVQRPVVASPPQVAVPQAEVTGAVKVGAGSAKPNAGWLRRTMRHDASRAALISYADSLADAIDRRETVLLDQLRGGPDTVMELEFQAGPRVRSAGGDDIGVLSTIGPYFRQQASPRRMLVIGEAGAGKTVLAVRLLLDQLHHRATLGDGTRAGEPVPIRVNAAGWDGSADFTSWLSHQLSIDYGLNSRMARAMVDSDLILPVLDGLDEMDPPDAEPDRARVALDRLNEPPWRNRPVVVMCRSDVYARLRELRGDAGLHGATTITLQPLSPIEICGYLHHYREQLGVPTDAWVAVTDQIGHDPHGPLATALRTPWLLGLAATALRRDPRTATQLAACGDTTESRDLLFAALIPAAIHGRHRTGRTRDYTEHEVQTWMHTLAQHLERRRAKARLSRANAEALAEVDRYMASRAAEKLDYALAASKPGVGTAQPEGETLAQYLERRRGKGTGGTEITLDQIWELAGTRRCRVLHALTVGLAYGLAAWLWAGLWAGLWSGFTERLAVGLTVGLGVGLWNLLPGRLENAAASTRFAWRVPGRSRWRKGLMVGLGAALLCLVYVSDREGMPMVAFVVGPILLGLVCGFGYGLQTNPEDRLALRQDARRIIHDDLVARLAYGLAYGLAVGLLFGLMSGRAIGLGGGLLIGLAYGLGSGPAGAYATASLVFAFTGIFAPRPAQFLEWARDSGLLRVTGIAYQCRHDSYQQWLAAGAVDRGVETTLDAQAG
jgi:hypothetical protein